MLDTSLTHLIHPRGQKETSEKHDNSESRNKSCQTVEFDYSNESYLTGINERLIAFSCTHTLWNITSRGKREQQKSFLKGFCYILTFLTQKLYNRTRQSWLCTVARAVSTDLVSQSLQCTSSLVPRRGPKPHISGSCRVPHTGCLWWQQVAIGDVACDAEKRLSFQPDSHWLCHREDGKDPVTTRFRSPFYLNILWKHAVMLYPSYRKHLSLDSLFPPELSITSYSPESTGFEMRRLFLWEEFCAHGSLYSRFQQVIHTMNSLPGNNYQCLPYGP